MVAVLIRFLTFPLCFALLLSRDAQVRANNRIDLDTSDQVAFLIGSNTTSGSVNQIITPDLSEYVQQLREQWNIPGMTLGVVHSGGKVELEAWGQRTEDGDEMTTDVSTQYPVRELQR